MESCYLEIVENLCIMLSGKCVDGLQFENQSSVDHQVSEILSKPIAVLIPNLKSLLRFYDIPSFLQTMFETVLIHLFKISIPEIDMNAIGDLPNTFYQLV